MQPGNRRSVRLPALPWARVGSADDRSAATAGPIGHWALRAGAVALQTRVPLHRAPLASSFRATGSTNGKPVVRRGRKATGLGQGQSAGLPNQGGSAMRAGSAVSTGTRHIVGVAAQAILVAAIVASLLFAASILVGRAPGRRIRVRGQGGHGNPPPRPRPRSGSTRIQPRCRWDHESRSRRPSPV